MTDFPPRAILENTDTTSDVHKMFERGAWARKLAICEPTAQDKLAASVKDIIELVNCAEIQAWHMRERVKESARINRCVDKPIGLPTF